MNRRRSLYNGESAQEGDWVLVFDAPMDVDLKEHVYGVTPTLNNASLQNNGMRVTGTRYYASAMYTMPVEYQNILQSSFAVKFEFDIYPLSFYSTSSNGNNYTGAFILGRWGKDYNNKSETALNDSQVAKTLYGNHPTYNNTSHSIYPINRWYHVSQSYNMDHNGLYIVSNDRGTPDITGVTSVTYGWAAGDYIERSKGVSLCIRRWSGGDTFTGYIKNVKVWVQI